MKSEGIWVIRTTGLAFLLLAVFTPLLKAQDLRSQTFLRQAGEGFKALYNLDHASAFRSFQTLRGRYPKHPGPPLYLALATWLEEMFDREELNLDRFVNPGYFTKQPKVQMSPQRRKLFVENIDASQELAEAILANSSGQTAKDAQYFLGSNFGVRASFAFTIDRSTRQAFSFGKKAYKHHSALVEADPEYADAYMSVGMYEYIVGNLPWYIKWIASIAGYRGSKERGFEYLKKASEEAVFVSDDARTLMMILLVFEKKYTEALKQIDYLRQRYPKNFILHLNRAQVLENLKDRDLALGEYLQVLENIEEGAPNYQLIPLKTFRYALGTKFLQLGQPQKAGQQFAESIQNNATPARERALSYLGAGKVFDLMGERVQAQSNYKQVLALPEFEGSHSQARRWLKRPFS